MAKVADEEAAPKVPATKPPAAGAPVLSEKMKAAAAARAARPTQDQVCYGLVTAGTCSYGERCKFSHDPVVVGAFYDEPAAKDLCESRTGKKVLRKNEVLGGGAPRGGGKKGRWRGQLQSPAPAAAAAAPSVGATNQSNRAGALVPSRVD